MKKPSASFKKDMSVKRKIVMVCIFQLIAYIFLMIFPARLLPFPRGMRFLELVVVLSIISITLIYWVIRFVDKIRYWIIGIPIIYGLAMLYTSHNALYYVRTGPSTYMLEFTPSGETYMIALTIFSIQCTLCIGKWGALKLFKPSTAKEGRLDG